ncbi:ubiquitin activating E1 enzyme-like protein [Klebsormidium nitens]|uniref:Ubiquitin-like modifier-activating enzyme ATG7 n=1 Tax=Klebsormidium nitens TaxID=105231 RepID=A0A1Y1IIG1_KLENI|nr:ubiquitin activating E1 enzyme-like protein [Klebsormidium nitens]|eukprot:GAQ88871.1 ubiquitin activating E1 enzyme-like protein [Klebsormidium nitens]
MAAGSGVPPDNTLPLLQFVPWQSAVDVGFWQKLAARKLAELRLSEAEQPLAGHFTASTHTQLSSPLHVGPDAWAGGVSEGAVRGGRAVAPGSCVLTNTLDGFKQADKKALLQAAAAKVWAAIVSGQAERDSALLNRFFLLTFADLKKWDFVYCVPPPLGEAMARACLAWKQAPPPAPPPDAVAGPPGDAVSDLAARLEASSVEDPGDVAAASVGGGSPFFLLHCAEGEQVTAHSLEHWSALQQQAGTVVAVYLDPCHLASHPGWPLRNLLALAVVRWRVRTLPVLALKETRGRPDWDRSLATTVHLPDLPEWRATGAPCPAAVGWERSAAGALGPRVAALGAALDPVQLAGAAVDLNLQLMRWRLLPSLDLPRLTATRCLLLGTGTLGCAVARTLLAWGVRDITLVDSGVVSFSNPVRQSLFTHADCLAGGRPKAEAAAAALRAIFPGAQASGVRLSIPMPGHAVGAREAPAVLAACAQLEQLIQTSDAVFLLTDTRESRWLPTLLAAAHNKLAINAALGFDTFLVMRHGAGPLAAPPPAPSADAPAAAGAAAPPLRLGCYFCNDVVAPLDSTAGRTLDQQCTVTRPGLAPMAAALAVELLVALRHHPAGLHAPADSTPPGAAFPAGATAQPLGLVPHQVRGFLAFFSQLLVTGHAFDKCTACSAAVVREYHHRGPDFLLQAFNTPTFLEDLTGLTALRAATDELLAEWEAGDDSAADADDF